MFASVFPRPERYRIVFLNQGTQDHREEKISCRFFNPALLEAVLTPGDFLIADSRIVE